MTPPAGTLTIDRLACTVLVPSDHPAPLGVRAAVDGLLRDHLAEACGRAVPEAVDESDPSVWLIDRLDVDLTVDLTLAGDARAAEAVGRRIAAGIAAAVAAGDDGTRVLRFRDRAAYLARFLSELAAGRAWGTWYLRPFDSLRTLPAHAAAREALVREPGSAEPALLNLAADDRLRPVLDLFTERDCLRVLDALATGPASPATPAALAAVVRLLSETSTPPVGRMFEPARAALRLYLGVRRSEPTLRPEEARSAASLVAVLAWAQASPAGEPVLARLLAGDMAGAVRAAASAGAEHVPRLVVPAGGPLPVAEVRAWVTPNGGPQPPAKHAVDFTRRVIAPGFGGVFLLLPAWTELSLDDSPEGAAHRYLALLACFGRRQAPLARHDPALFLAAGLDEAPSQAVLEALPPFPGSESLDAPDPDDAAFLSLLEPPPGLLRDEALSVSTTRVAITLLRRFARRLVGFHRSSAAHLVRNFLDGPSELHISAGEIEVRLAERPLHVVLRMADVDGEPFTPAWLSGRRVRFVLAGGDP